jgi:CO/xanthine dehydrogenase FAD-binding subunit
MLHASGLDRVAVEGDRVTIGAATPVSALLDLDDEALVRVAAELGDGEIRRSATVGGNICAPAGDDAQRCDLGAPLIALGATVRSVGRGGERSERLEDFLGSDRTGRLVLDVSYASGRRSAGVSKRRRHGRSYAVATVAASVAADGSDLRVGIAGVGPTAVRARAVESSRSPESVADDVQPVDDAVASARYRTTILPLLVREVLERLGVA